MKQFGFNKCEHLTGDIAIETLFTQGKSFVAFPMRVVYLLGEKTANEPAVRVMVVARKKRFKHAVDRNRIKRLMREAYRLNKHIVYELANEKNQSLHIAFINISNELPTFDSVNEHMQKALTKIASEL